MTKLKSLSKGEKKNPGKNRAQVKEDFLKLMHVQRQEVAESQHEEKKRAAKG